MQLLDNYWSNIELFDPHLTINSVRTLRVPQSRICYFSTSDNVTLRLKRFQGGEKGPVILSHCIGTSSLMYSLGTIKTNLLEFLFERGFDVWLFDHRLSIELQPPSNQFTLDDVANKDYPAAVNKVREISGCENVQIVAHGVGALTVTMALLSGLQHVSAVVCSQVSTHLDSIRVNQIKAKMVLLSTPLLKLFGKRWMTAYTDTNAGLSCKLYNGGLMVYPVPSQERCNSAVCHRITSLFGELYKHSQLNDETHFMLARLFGRVSINSMQQLAAMFDRKQLIDANGDNVYLPNINNLKLPMTFISGSNNDYIAPSSTQKTIELLSDANGSQYYKRFEIANYGHIDCIIGKNAARDIYPCILDRLESKTVDHEQTEQLAM